MKAPSILLLLLTASLFTSCGNSTSKSGAQAEASASADLVGQPPSPEGVHFERKEFFPGATLAVPQGEDWIREENRITSKTTGFVIVLQNQTDNMLGIERDYLNSYNDVNIRDAPGWQRGQESLGKIRDIQAARTEGTFNNGTDMVTRDYVFFTQKETGILQCRVPAKDKALLAPLADYIAGSIEIK